LPRALGRVQGRADARPGNRRRRQPSRCRCGSDRGDPGTLVKLGIVTPSSYIGTLMELSKNRRGTFLEMEYLDPSASFSISSAAGRGDRRLLRSAQDSHPGLRVDGLRGIGYRRRIWSRSMSLSPETGRCVVSDSASRPGSGDRARARPPPARPDPRQMFDVAVQAAIGSNVIARETSSPCARTSLRNAMAATSLASVSCSRSRKRGSSG